MASTSALPAEDVEVLGVPLDAGVAREGIGAAHQVVVPASFSARRQAR